VQGGEPRLLCNFICNPQWSPDAASLYLGTQLESRGETLVVPLPRGRAFPDFPEARVDAFTHWKTLPTARIIERRPSIPGLDVSTYVERRTEERRNLFRLPLPR
jgi:hypothetical protein